MLQRLHRREFLGGLAAVACIEVGPAGAASRGGGLLRGNNAPPVLGLCNFNRGYLSNWRKARDNARNGNSNGIILCVGDSTTVGYGSQGASFVNMKSGSIATQLAAYLTNAGIPAGVQNCWGDFGNNTDCSTYDPRLSLGGWDLNGGVRTMGGATYEAQDAGAGTLSWTPTVATDTCEIYYVTASGLGSFNANVNGGSNTLQSTNATSGYSKVTITGTLGMNVYNMLWASGAVFIIGFNAYNSAVKQISILNMGQSFASIEELSNNIWVSEAALIAAIAPVLFTIQIGINDWLGGVPASGFSPAVQALILSALSVGSNVLVLTPMQSSAANTPYATQQQYLNAFIPSGLPGCVILDVNSRWGGWDAANARGFMLNDGIHALATGYGDQAQAAGQILLAA